MLDKFVKDKELQKRMSVEAFKASEKYNVKNVMYMWNDYILKN
ncbi:hypothetical protein GCM10011508_14660 [Flavobacterium lutivivi]|jgi:hypothetical protein|nr:hypothetical protein GCM10011508_14660 [Flavobacterium lutivivi]